MKAQLIIGIVLAVTGVISIAVGLIRGKGNLNISKKTTLVIGFVLLAVGAILLITYVA
jgi:hypothetical protein